MTKKDYLYGVTLMKWFHKDNKINVRKLTSVRGTDEVENTIRKGMLLLGQLSTDWYINTVEWSHIIHIILDALPSKDIDNQVLESTKVSYSKVKISILLTYLNYLAIESCS